MTWTPGQSAAWISDGRLEPFLRQAQGDLAHAEALYVWHADLGGAIHVHIHHVEVLIRNAMDQALVARGASEDWLIDPSILSERALADVNSARRGVASRADGDPRAHGDVVAALHFGFWRSMLHARYENLWRSTVRFAFPNLPGQQSRKDIGKRLEAIRKFRNRVAHHDSLLSIDIAARLREMASVTDAIDPDATRWIASHSQVQSRLGARPF